MFLIDDNQADIGKRRENGGPGADHHMNLSPPDPPPFIKAFTGGKAGVKDGRILAEAGAKPGNHLRREGDFRHENDGRFSQAGGMTDGTDKHFGLSGTGDAVQQELPFPFLNSRQYLTQHGILLVSEHRVLVGMRQKD